MSHDGHLADSKDIFREFSLARLTTPAVQQVPKNLEVQLRLLN